MPLNYSNLDQRTRLFMVEEIDMDVNNGTIYLSPWLSDRGRSEYPTLLRGAAQSGDDESLAAELRVRGRLNTTAQRRKPKGGFTTYTVPATAPETMAEGEFNRFYVRALCRRALEDGISHLIVYRAKEVMTPRPGSEEKIGRSYEPAALLHDLRTTPGLEPALGLPPGPNSGLTVKLP